MRQIYLTAEKTPNPDEDFIDENGEEIPEDDDSYFDEPDQMTED